MQICRNCNCEMELTEENNGGNYKVYSCLNEHCGTTLVREEGHDDAWDKEKIECIYATNVTTCFKSVEDIKELIAMTKKDNSYYELCEHIRNKFEIANLICFDVVAFNEKEGPKEQIIIVEFPIKPDGKIHNCFFRPRQKPFLIMDI